MKLQNSQISGILQPDAAWLDAHWMPYTGNREFKANPRLIASAKGSYYTDQNGKKYLMDCLVYGAAALVTAEVRLQRLSHGK